MELNLEVNGASSLSITFNPLVRFLLSHKDSMLHRSNHSSEADGGMLNPLFHLFNEF